ncbi:hypothetical protein GCM10017581_039330 [Dactylosporangium matsuzakiense]|uniref:DDE family transposase n=1 Tax=Dactylosporangium matsuzakiense TaxID=53360 RepID=A0A9W6KHG9_9ACTN|nr:hypothetical protein GCM10017581_039330 [Dactylosporangium matsuzakiense]
MPPPEPPPRGPSPPVAITGIATPPNGAYANADRRALRAKGIKPHIARRGKPHGSRLGVYRRVVERTIAWYHGMKRLRVRWERRDDIHEAFLSLATCIITYRHIVRLC